MSPLDLEVLMSTKNRYEQEKKAWGLLNKTVMKDWSQLKARRQELNKRMRKSESEIVKIVVYGVECSGCGSPYTQDETIAGGYPWCCPARKIIVRGSEK
jgi:hypothetical protein